MHATGGLMSVEGFPFFSCMPAFPGGVSIGPGIREVRGGIHSTLRRFLPDTDLSGIHFF